MTTPWGKGEAGKESKDLSLVFKTGFLKRHELSTSHTAAVCQMLLIDGAPAAPPANDFRTLLQSLQAGNPQKNNHGATYSDKYALMTWSLHEALLDMERQYNLSFPRQVQSTQFSRKPGYAGQEVTDIKVVDVVQGGMTNWSLRLLPMVDLSLWKCSDRNWRLSLPAPCSRNFIAWRMKSTWTKSSFTSVVTTMIGLGYKNCWHVLDLLNQQQTKRYWPHSFLMIRRI